MISGSAESPNVWKAKPEYNFGVIPAVDTSAGKSLGVLAGMSNPKAASAAVIGVNEPFSKETGEGFLQRSEEHTSELQSLMRISYAVFCLKKKNIIPELHQP